MSRYIDADHAEFRLQCCGTYHGVIAFDTVKAVLNDAPSIDIEPKRGAWKPFDLTWGRSIWYCTACEESTEVPCDIWEHKPIYKYCPNCGADMREREGD